ncbi:MAG: hypothetical protein OXN20_03525 [Gemmatimonadota bacterium]|nr:hypothetical protein [Gemmatimonadota bacterium]
MEEQVRDIKRQSWIEGAYEQMDKRIKLMEDLYQSIERKLWTLIALAIGSLLGVLASLVGILLK